MFWEVLQYIVLSIVFIISIYNLIILSHLTEEKAPEYDFRIIHTTADEVNDIQKFISNIDQELVGKTSIYSFCTNKPTKENTEKAAYISPNDIYIKDTAPIGAYKALISSSYQYTILNTDNENNDITWVSSDEYIKERSLQNSLYTQNSSTKTEIEGLSSSNSKFTIMRYLINGNKAIHINYIHRKHGLNKIFNYTVFYNFLHWVREYIKTNKIEYYSISGDSMISSSRWKRIANMCFLDEKIYMSPGTENSFYTNIRNKKAFTSDFMIISKKLAPNGVRFYIHEHKYDYFNKKYLLIGEALNNKKHAKKSINDQTKFIEREVEMFKKLDVNFSLDILSENLVHDKLYIKDMDNKITPESE